MSKSNSNRIIETFDGDEWQEIICNKLTGEVAEISGKADCKQIAKKIIQVITELKCEGTDTCMDFNIDNSFIKDFRGNGKLFRILLTSAEIALLEFLSDYICYGDCILRKGGNAQGHEMTVSELAVDYGMEYAAFRRLMSSLRKKQVIEYHSIHTVRNVKGELIDSRCISFNPYIKCRGNGIEIWVRDMYSSSIWANIMRQKVKVNIKTQGGKR